MTAGERIRTARLAKGLTQNALGEKCGIAEPTIRRYELGKLNPKPSTLQKIADALDLPLSFFQATPPFEDLTFLEQYKGVILNALDKNNLFSWNARALTEVGNYEFWKAVSDHIISLAADANGDLSIQYGPTNKECSLEKIVTIKGMLNLDFNKVLNPLIARGCAVRTFLVLKQLNSMNAEGHEKVLHFAEDVAKDPDYMQIEQQSLDSPDPQDKK